MLKIDFAAFFKHHYWMGWYHWNSCDLHKRFKTRCPYCEDGGWKFIEDPGKDNSKFAIFKMPMNNVLWPDEEDA